MSGINERVQIFLNNIRDDNNVETNLQDLKVLLTNINTARLSDVAQSSQLNILFDCLNSSDKNQILSTCELLKIILPTVPLSQLISRYLTSLIRALGHPQPEVKVVILDQLIRAVRSEILANGEHSASFLSSVGKCLCHEDVSVGKRAVEFFIQFGKTKHGLVAVCQPAFIRELIQNVGENNVYVLRVFDVLVEISSTSGDFLKYLENEGLLDRLTTFLRTDDVLAMLSLVEVCTKLALTHHGWDFLKRHGIIKQLAEQVVSFEDDPLSSLKYPGLSKFFGQVGQSHPSLLMNDYPEVLRCIFKAVDSDDLNIFIPSLEVIGMIAYSPEGKLVLQKQDEKYMRHAIGRISVAMTKLPIEWRLRALHTLANVIHIETELITPEILRINETWFNQLGNISLLSLLEMARQPFSDLKAAALLIILNMANQKWGVNKILENPEVIEYLLDRRTETEVQALHMKYNILKTMITSMTEESHYHIRARDYENIAQYVRQGPFYAPSTTEVALEGAE